MIIHYTYLQTMKYSTLTGVENIGTMSEICYTGANMSTFKLMLKALGFTIITFGSLHLIISYILMFVRDYNEGNLFRILNIQKLFPGIDLGWGNFIISNIIAISLYLIYLGLVIHLSKKSQKKAE